MLAGLHFKKGERGAIRVPVSVAWGCTMWCSPAQPWQPLHAAALMMEKTTVRASAVTTVVMNI